MCVRVCSVSLCFLCGHFALMLQCCFVCCYVAGRVCVLNGCFCCAMSFCNHNVVLSVQCNVVCVCAYLCVVVFRGCLCACWSLGCRCMLCVVMLFVFLCCVWLSSLCCLCVLVVKKLFVVRFNAVLFVCLWSCALLFCEFVCLRVCFRRLRGRFAFAS